MIGNEYRDPSPSPEGWHVCPKQQVSKCGLRPDPKVHDLSLDVIFVVVQSLSCVRLCDPMDCNRTGFPVLHDLPEFAQTLVWALYKLELFSLHITNTHLQLLKQIELFFSHRSRSQEEGSPGQVQQLPESSGNRLLPSFCPTILSVRLLPHALKVPAVAPGITSAFQAKGKEKEKGPVTTESWPL